MSRVRPHELATEGLADGRYSVTIAGGVIAWASLTSVTDVVVSVTNGSPSFVIDTDGTPVTTETP